MTQKQRKIAMWVFGVLLLGNIIYYGFCGWGLITINVHDAPLSKVIRSIEWQGWVKIYSNVEPTTKVTMYVDHVPLAEAMETLAGEIGGQWKLGFFVAPSAVMVKQEIRSFQSDTKDDASKVYSYPTMLQLVATSSEMAAADPRLQQWPGMKATPPAPAPAPAPDGSTPDVTSAKPADDPDAGTVQAYLRALALSADIWIMSPVDWKQTVSSAPPPNSSIASAVKELVSSARGSVTQAIILRGRGERGMRGPGGPRGGGGFGDFDSMADRMRNAIGGLPPGDREEAMTQLNDEIQFRQSIKNATPQQRQDMMRQHMMMKMADAGGPPGRMSPQKRAQRFQRMVAARAAAAGKH